jgi:pre-mRNA-splicing factor ATP-dependent RNA helicase DHX38/PRP16
VHTRRQEQANLVKDPTGDMSKISMKGSNLLREYREKRDQHRGRQRFWEMKGSAMGNAIGIVDDGHPEDATEAAKFDRPMADGEDGAEKHFGELLKAKNVARSDFSRSKTMAQQRQALPIFACKESILRAVRENSVVVVEGETGSGKTTQLVQFMHEAGYTKLGKIGCTQVNAQAAPGSAVRASRPRHSPVASRLSLSPRESRRKWGAKLGRRWATPFALRTRPTKTVRKR